MNLRKYLPGKMGNKDTVIPVVRLKGMIAAGGSFPTSSVLSLATCAPVLARAFADKKAPAVAISINSPGGSPVQSRLIYQRIRDLAQKHEKKVLMFVEDVAASGGYMIALAGDEIIADETSIVGSIGVVSAGFGFDKLIEKIGVDRRVYTAGKNKVMLDPFQPEKKTDIAYLKELQLDIHQVFVDMVKARRGDRLADNPDLFTGKFWTGTLSKELGLVDQLGHMAPVLQSRYGKDVKLKLVQAKRGLFGRSVPGVAGSLFSPESTAMVAEAALGLAEEKAMRARFGL